MEKVMSATDASMGIIADGMTSANAPRRFRAAAARRFAVLLVASVVALELGGVASAGVARHATASTVTVTFTDTTLRVSPVSPESGRTTFVVFNKGKKHHLLAITGPGIKNVRTAKLAPGGRGTLTVTLRAGAYVLSDPIGLGAYNVQFLDIVPAADVTATGVSSVVSPPVTPPPMCGSYLTP
jgi:hypothetical protein